METMEMRRERINGLKPEVPAWAKAENMEMSCSQHSLWNMGGKKHSSGRRSLIELYAERGDLRIRIKILLEIEIRFVRRKTQNATETA